MKRVPDIKDMHIDDAKEVLEKSNIDINEEIGKITFNTKINHVIDTDPDIGEEVPYDNKIDIKVSKLRLLPFLILLAWLLLIGLGFLAYYLSTSPKLKTSDEQGHGDNTLIEIEEDSKMLSGDIDYYLYCVNSENDIESCEWERTDTKNIVVSKSGKWYVWFKAVSKTGEISAPSKVKEINVDNEPQEIDKLITSSTTTTIDVKVVLAEDFNDNNYKVYYSLDNGEYIEDKDTHVFENLKPDTEYLVSVRIIDENDNEYILTRKVRTKKEDDNKTDDGGNTPEKNNENEPTNPLNPDQTTNPEQPEELQAPRIDLSGIPRTIKNGFSYNVPTSYWFDEKGGEISCKLEDDTVITNTDQIDLGTHIISCVANGNNGLSVTVKKIIEVEVNAGEDEEFDGWIRLNLFYPSNSINRQYIIRKENQVNTGYNIWQPYTGPFLVKVEDVNDVYIKYTLNGKTYIESPSGNMVVLVEPDSYEVQENETTKVNIYYDEKATTKEYRINGGAWLEYEGEFEVEGNTLIEARGQKMEKVYDNEGNYQYDAPINGSDNAYIITKVEAIRSVIPGTPDEPGNPYSPYVPSNPSNPSGPKINVGDYPPGGYKYISGGGGGLTPAGPGEKPEVYIYPEAPVEVLEGPIINSSNTSNRTLSTTINISTLEEASKIYYSVNGGSYKEYTEPFELRYNAIIRAYYIRKIDGKTSKTNSYRVMNISNGPVINVSYSPDYLTTYTSSTTATLSASYYTGDIEYSLDGEIYQKYTEPITINKSLTLYARAYDENNKYSYYSETITLTTQPRKTNSLDVSIYANPEKSYKLLSEVEVEINYDNDATKKYYRLSTNEDWKEYTGKFTINKNSTVYAYATNDNGDKGYATKKIDYLYNGISSPTFKVEPSGASPLFKVDIEFDSNATIKRYSLDGENFYDYIDSLYIDQNMTIYAMNMNEKGDKAESKYTINNITPLPKIQTIDKGKYIYVKLNYPEFAGLKEYKWKDDGVWKEYPSTGILFIKPEFKNEFDETAEYYSVEDNYGKTVNISKEHTYALDVLSSDIFYNLFMRWDTVGPTKPEFIVTPSEPTKEVMVLINFDNSSVKKMFKVVYEDSEQTDWLDYSEAIKIVKNNCVIYAKSMNESEVWSEVNSIKITNIDNKSPEIDVKGDFTTPKRKVSFTINATDDLALESVGYLKGSHSENDMKKNATYITNNHSVQVNENGVYTIIAIDKVGNVALKEIEITNVDNNVPNITITTSNYELENASIYREMAVTIDYDDSILKEYSFDNVNWNNYEGTFRITSYDMYQYKNGDNSLTIYARGKDEADNTNEVQETIYNLDLDIPNKPIININGSYPVLNEYGIELNLFASIDFDSRNDIDNYYCLDNCNDEHNWILYNGIIKLDNASGEIKAKSVKNSSHVVIEDSIDYSLPEDSLEELARDNNRETSITLSKAEYVQIDPIMIGKKINIIVGDASGIYYNFTNENKVKLGSDIQLTNNKTVITIPSNAKYLYISANNKVLKEVEVNTDATFNTTSTYPMITNDNVVNGYNNITISYTPTAVLREYSYDNINWITYDNKTIKINVGDNLYARQTDKYNNVSEVSIYESSIDDMIQTSAFDNDDSTYDNVGNSIHRLDISSTVRGKILNVRQESTSNITLKYYDNTDTLISNDERQGTLREFSYLIPSNASYVTFSGTNLKVYEVKIAELPELVPSPRIIVSDEDNYALTKLVTIYYPGNQYTNEYSIDGCNTWNEYTEPFEINHYTTIYARSKDNGTTVSSATYKVNKLASKVTYVTNVDDMEVNPKLVVYGSQYGLLPDLYRDYYNFGGWYLDVDLTIPVTETTLVNNKFDHNLYAKWTPHTYNISVDAIHGTVSERNLTVVHGGSKTITVIPDSGYSLKSATCDNGYTIDAVLGSETAQEVTINSNGNTGDSTCAISFRKASCVVTQSKYVRSYNDGIGPQMDGTFTGTYNCNGTNGSIQSCSYVGTVLFNSNRQSVNTTCMSTNACTVKNNYYVSGRNMWFVNNQHFNTMCDSRYRDSSYFISPELPSQISCSCDEINVKVNVEGGTASDNMLTVTQGGTTQVTISPDQDDYELESASCTNGYTISNVTVSSATTSASGSQTVTINNNSSLDDSICTFKYKKYCSLSQHQYVSGGNDKLMYGTFTATYKCNNGTQTASISTCAFDGQVRYIVNGYPRYGSVNTTCSSASACTIKNNYYVPAQNASYVNNSQFSICSNIYSRTDYYQSPELPSQIPCSCD